MSPLKLAVSRGRGMFATVKGQGVSLWHKGDRALPPMFVMNEFSFEVDLGTLFQPLKVVHSVSIDRMEINVPPKDARPKIDSDEGHGQTNVFIEEVIITNSVLRILPKEDDKAPLQFDLHRIRLESARLAENLPESSQRCGGRAPRPRCSSRPVASRL